MPPAPSHTPIDLVLHVGSGKTGTSSIQYFLHRNRDRLAEHGYLYPSSPGRTRHGRLGLFIRSGAAFENSPLRARQKQTDEASFKRAFQRKLFAEIERSAPSLVILSDEAVYNSSEESLRLLRSFTDRFGGVLRIVVYLRRQDDHLISRYQQAVKTGEVRRLADRTRARDFAHLYDHHARLGSWQRLLEPAELVIRRFERECFAGGSLYQDFLEAAGLEVPLEELEHVEPLNESLDAESVEFLRLLNLYWVEHEAERPALKEHRRLIRRLVQSSSGPALTLPEPLLDAFMAQWDESNRRVALELLGDPTGQLFRTPRKTANTTTEQWLDPARLDHFLTLAALPEHAHAALRQLAQREAQRGRRHEVAEEEHCPR